MSCANHKVDGLVLNKKKYSTRGHVYIIDVLYQWLGGKESAKNAGAASSIPGSKRSPGEGRAWQPTPVFLPWTEESGGLPSTGLESRTRLK